MTSEERREGRYQRRMAARRRKIQERNKPFEEVFSFENLYKGYLRSRKGVMWKASTQVYKANALPNIRKTQLALLSGTWKSKGFVCFDLYDRGKLRHIRAVHISERVVQHALCDNVLGPRVLPSFIKDNYASQEGKGTHFGLDRLEEFMRRFYRKKGVDGWVLKGDIRKYFYSIRHDVLKELVRKYVDDPECLWLLDMIIDSTEGNVGIPIGNQSSQLFALLYLSPLDHFIKEKLGVKFYGRYMDDFYLIHEDKEYLRYCWKEIERRVNEIGLSLNEKTAIYPLKNGIDFLGFHTYLTETGAVIRKVRRKSKSNARRKVKKLCGLMEAGKIGPDTVKQSYQSWRGHAAKGNCYHLIRKMDQHFNKYFNKAAAALKERDGGSISEKGE